MNKATLFKCSAVSAILALGVVAWLFNRDKITDKPGTASDKTATREDGKQIAAADTTGKLREDGLGGKAGGTASGQTPQELSKKFTDYGTIKPISASASPQAKAAVEAALGKNHPERLSCAILPAAFDAKRWASDADYKAEYLRIPEPARCYQAAQPGKETQRIALASPAYVPALQSQPVELAVKATPGMPVTFTSFDAATFTAGSGNTGSQLTTQTVVADDNGIATATLVAGTGVINDCRVVASCPVDAGLVHITVHATLPSGAQQNVPVAINAPETSLTAR